MNPKFPRSGIKITDENYVYYCEEMMNNRQDYYLRHHTGKYKFFKSENKVDFDKYSGSAGIDCQIEELEVTLQSERLFCF